MTCTFYEGFPEGLKLNVDPGIFHTRKHLHLQSVTGWRSFYARSTNSVEAVVFFHVNGSSATSPLRSPFGSFLFSESVDPATLAQFIAFCETVLRESGVRQVTLKNQPENYSAKNTLLREVLVNAEYTIATEETSAIIRVKPELFEKGLHKSERKKLRKCREHNLLFEQVEAVHLQKIYSFLEACRNEKGYALSMSVEVIENLVRSFPGRVMLTAVMDNNKIAAANISIRVFDHVLYNFYHDHASEYDGMSPVVMLNEGLYKFCQDSNITYLDLGTSNIHGTINQSLLNFKLNLGATPSRKLTFVKNLES